MHNGIADRYGLPMSTGSITAAEKWVEGLDLVLEMSFGPEERFQEAIAADEEPYRKRVTAESVQETGLKERQHARITFGKGCISHWSW